MGIYPSVFRLYVAPTLTLGVGIAMCFGTYATSVILPKPFRDLGGNCVVFAVPPITNCPKDSNAGNNQPSTEVIQPSIVAAGGQGTCNNPPKISNTIAFDDTTQTNTIVSTANSPFQIVAAGSSANNPPYSAAIPQGNFG
jgi:hypothetical protein